jgi:hypothetical protein
MKTNHIDEQRKALIREMRDEKNLQELGAIFAFCDAHKMDDHSVKLTMDAFGCDRRKVLRAMSYFLGFQKNGSKGKH